MKGVVFTAIACTISYIVSSYLPNPPGMAVNLQLLAIVAAIAGAGLAYLLEKEDTKHRVISLIVATLIFTVSIISYIIVSHGEPGAAAEIALYALTVATFAPIGYIFEVAGIKYS